MKCSADAGGYPSVIATQCVPCDRTLSEEWERFWRSASGREGFRTVRLASSGGGRLEGSRRQGAKAPRNGNWCRSPAGLLAWLARSGLQAAAPRARTQEADRWTTELGNAVPGVRGYRLLAGGAPFGEADF